MRVTIIADDGKVGVAGAFRGVDLSSLDATIHAVQSGGAPGVLGLKDRTREHQL